jgi:hypothetical protein
MPSQPIRYLLNTATGTLHDRRHLRENCNTDDIERRMRFVTNDRDEAKAHLAYRRDCRYCGRKVKVVQNPDLEPTPDAAPA